MLTTAWVRGKMVALAPASQVEITLG